MFIQILDRFEPHSEWHEIYINGDLVFEGEIPKQGLDFAINKLLEWLHGKTELDVETRKFIVDYSPDEHKEYSPPLHSITGETYWEDWEKAKENE
jgi:hypothetical protein